MAVSELQVIQSTLERAARRRRWARGLRGMWVGLLAGAVLSLLLTGAYHLWPLPLWMLPLAALIPIPCLLIGFVVGGWRKVSLAQIARGWMVATSSGTPQHCLEVALIPEPPVGAI